MKFLKIGFVTVLACWFLFVGAFLFWNFGPAVDVMGFKTKAANKVADYRDGSIGIERYRMLLDATEAYRNSKGEIPAAVAEGKELAPAAYLNEYLEKSGAKFRVRRIEGMEVDFYEIS